MPKETTDNTAKPNYCFFLIEWQLKHDPNDQKTATQLQEGITEELLASQYYFVLEPGMTTEEIHLKSTSRLLKE